MFPTPDLGPQFDKDLVYDPSEDTFLLLDAIEQLLGREKETLHWPTICVEIGSGSGLVITFLAQILKSFNPARSSYFLATDVNPFATLATQSTARKNHQASIESIQADLLGSVSSRLAKSIDLLLFNPPYVETGDEEFQTSIRPVQDAQQRLYASWSGGASGSQVTRRVLDMLPNLLAIHGSLLLVAAHCNRPEALIEQFLAQHSANSWHVQIVKKAQCGIELLYVLRFEKLSDAS